jgi:hypothetical protein
MSKDAKSPYLDASIADVATIRAGIAQKVSAIDALLASHFALDLAAAAA